MPFPPRYTPEQIAWLKKHTPLHPHRATRKLFEATFGEPLSNGALKSLVQRHPDMLGAPNTAHFKKGSTPPNKGKGRPKAPRRRQKGPKGRPMFSERVDHRSGGHQSVLLIKVPGPSPLKSWRATNSQKRSHWMKKSRWVWEQANGPIPKGHVVIHLNGDWRNCELENLEAVPKAVALHLNMGPRPTGDDQINAVRLLIAKLLAAGKEAEREKAA